MLALVLCLALAAPALAVDTSGLNANTAKAYYEALTGYNAPLYADLRDMDGNGVAELIIVDKTGAVDIWQIKDGKVAKGTSVTPDTSMQGMEMQILTKSGKAYLCASTDWARSGNYTATHTIIGTDGYAEKLTKSGYMGDEADEHANCSRVLNGKESKITAAQYSQYYNAYIGWDGATILIGGGSEWYANDEATANYKTVQAQLASKMSESAAPAGAGGKYTLAFQNYSGSAGTITFDSAVVKNATVKCNYWDYFEDDYEGEGLGNLNIDHTEYEDFVIVTLRSGSNIAITGGDSNNGRGIYARDGELSNNELNIYPAGDVPSLYSGAVNDIWYLEGADAVYILATTPKRTIVCLDKGAGFSDVAADAYYAAPVAWAIGKGITNGTGNNTFSPAKTCSTAEILTFLYRANGSPAPTTRSNPYSDVKSSDYYYNAALWAREKGLTDSGARFNGSAPCTRAAVVTYLWKLAGKPSARNAAFSDVPSTADYAQAVAWAIGKGITNGAGNNQFLPNKTCTRGEIVTFLYRAYAK